MPLDGVSDPDTVVGNVDAETAVLERKLVVGTV